MNIDENTGFGKNLMPGSSKTGKPPARIGRVNPARRLFLGFE
jgi:hypothetical protein